MATAPEIISKHLDTTTTAGLGVMVAVACNIAEHNGIERCLTYLLGAMDCAGANGNKRLAESIRSAREELKATFRN